MSQNDYFSLTDPFSETKNTFSDEYIRKVIVIANDALQKNVAAPPSINISPENTIAGNASQKKFSTKVSTARKIISELKVWIIAILVICVIRWTGIFVPNKVEGVSMEPNFHSGNIVFTSKLAPIDRYDVVTATSPNDLPVIKRVIGLPGDKIEVKKGHVYINGKKSKESFVKDKGYDQDTEDMTYDLQDGQYFLSGDNRLNSTDSRYYGPVLKSQIHGQVIFTLPITSGSNEE